MRRVLIHFSVLLGLALALASPLPAHAFDILCYVNANHAGPEDGTSWGTAYADLQSALTNGNCVEIWVAWGVYKPASAGNASTSFVVLPNVAVYGGFLEGMTLRSQRNPDLNVTILSGDINNNDANAYGTDIDETTADIIGEGNSNRVVRIDGTGTAVTQYTVLDGFTITAGDGGPGAGLYCNGDGTGAMCSPTLAHLRFSGNRAGYGGAAYFMGGGGTSGLNAGVSSPALADVSFSGNRAENFGGAIYLNGGDVGTYSVPSFTNVTFTNNEAGVSGGAMYILAESPSLSNVTFTDNTATVDGGAMYSRGGGFGISPSLTNVTFQHNIAGQGGGGMLNNGEEGGNSPTLLNATFSGNGAQGGGGMLNDAYGGVSSPTLTNVTFRLNTASTLGGAMLNAAQGGTSSPILRNVTFSLNSANFGGAISGDAYGGDSSPALTNVILWGDTATNSGPEIYNSDATPTISYSVVEGDCGSIPGVTCGSGNGNDDPKLGTLKNNGGFTQTMALLEGSSAIDTGDDAVCGAAPVSGLDQRGVSRPQGSNCDIGAYEYQAHVFADVPVGGKEWMEPWVEQFYYNGITTGCGASPLIYCPENPVTRASMAVFILRAEHGASYVPPATTHTFSDMPVAGKEWMEPWVDQLYAEGITTGCGAGPIFCPENPVTRSAMAVFLLRALEGSSYTPPAATHTFADLPVAGKEWMEPWVDEFYTRGITTGCGAGPLIYCPENPVTRAAMAVFIDRAYSLYP